MILEEFSLRPGSGGAGKYCGGDGVIRKLLFRNKVILSVLTERRSTRPYGLQGKLLSAFSSVEDVGLFEFLLSLAVFTESSVLLPLARR